MTADLMLREYNSLPESLQAMALEFVLLLKNRKEVFLKPATDQPVTPKFGFGKYEVSISPDFDEPLECFKEYMP